MGAVMGWLLVAALAVRASGLPDEPERTYDKLFQWGVGSYSEQRWYPLCASTLHNRSSSDQWLTEQVGHASGDRATSMRQHRKRGGGVRRVWAGLRRRQLRDR